MFNYYRRNVDECAAVGVGHRRSIRLLMKKKEEARITVPMNRIGSARAEGKTERKFSNCFEPVWLPPRRHESIENSNSCLIYFWSNMILYQEGKVQRTETHYQHPSSKWVEWLSFLLYDRKSNRGIYSLLSLSQLANIKSINISRILIEKITIFFCLPFSVDAFPQKKIAIFSHLANGNKKKTEGKITGKKRSEERRDKCGIIIEWVCRKSTAY